MTSTTVAIDEDLIEQLEPHQTVILEGYGTHKLSRSALVHIIIKEWLKNKEPSIQ